MLIVREKDTAKEINSSIILKGPELLKVPEFLGEPCAETFNWNAKQTVKLPFRVLRKNRQSALAALQSRDLSVTIRFITPKQCTSLLVLLPFYLLTNGVDRSYATKRFTDAREFCCARDLLNAGLPLNCGVAGGRWIIMDHFGYETGRSNLWEYRGSKIRIKN